MSCDMWFGTKDYAQFIRTPQTGADVSPSAWGVSGTFLNGAGYALNSFNSHKEYQFSWGSSAAREAAQTMKSYFDGSFGRGKLHFVDPLTYSTNVLPARWADPSITANFEGPRLVPGVDPYTVPTSNFQWLRLPVRTTVFDLDSVQPVVNTVFLPEAENLFTNPNLVGDGTWAEVRRNRLMHPILSQSLDGWSTTTLATRELAPGVGVKVIVNGPIGSATHAIWVTPEENYTSVAAGDIVRSLATVSVPSDAPRAIPLRSRLTIRDSGGVTGTDWFSSAEVWVEPGESHTFVLEREVSAGLDLAQFVILGAGPQPLDVGDVFILHDGVTVEVNSPYAPTPIAPGIPLTGIVQPEDFRWRWLGEPNESESVMEIEQVAGLTAVNCVAGVSTRDGKPAVRIIPTGAGVSGTYTLFPSTASSVTGVGTVSLDAPLQGTLDDQALSLKSGGASVAAPNLAGDHPLRVMGGSHSGGYVDITLYHGGAQDSGDVWWTDIGLFAGDYTGPWFSGDTEIPGKVTRWTGAPNDSTSQIGVLQPVSTPNINEENSVFVPIPDGMQLNVGAFYSSDSSDSGVYVVNAIRGGGTGNNMVRLQPLQNNTNSLFPNVFTKQPGDNGIYLWIGKTANVNDTVNVTAIHARLSPIGVNPQGENYWLGGQGNEGVRFVQPPTYINHTGVNGGQVEFAATFKESVL